MRRRSLGALLVMSAVLCSNPVWADDGTDLVSGNTAFALEMYRQLASSEDAVVFSPYSISTALGMTYAGARNNTEMQMTQVLHVSLGHDLFYQANSELVKNIEENAKTGGYEFSIANSIWIQTGYQLKQDFLDIQNQFYGAAPQEVDFISSPEAQRLIINQWVEAKTRTRIKDLIASGMLTNMTRLVLVNALYFKGHWASVFDPAFTADEDFDTGGGSKVNARLMNQTGDFRYSENDELQAIELPYENEKFSMIVLLPRSNDLAAIEKELSPFALDRYMSGMLTAKVEVVLPKFKAEASFTLNDQLKALGMAEAFDMNSADFSGMKDLTEDRLYIGYVIHKAFVEVDEVGSEAAAATAVLMMAGMGMPMDPPEIKLFRADHPFIFLIRDNQTGSILFMGRVTDPSK